MTDGLAFLQAEMPRLGQPPSKGNLDCPRFSSIRDVRLL